MKIYQAIYSFHSKKDLKLTQKKIHWKKLEIQVIISMIILTRSSERIFNPMRYTGVFIMRPKYLPQYLSLFLINARRRTFYYSPLN